MDPVSNPTKLDPTTLGLPSQLAIAQTLAGRDFALRPWYIEDAQATFTQNLWKEW